MRLLWCLTAVALTLSLAAVLLTFFHPGPRDFSSVTELEEFLARDKTNEIINPDWDCEDYAQELQRNALKEGYIINLQLIGRNSPKLSYTHMLNSTVIQDVLFLIQPTTDEIIGANRLDPLDLESWQPVYQGSLEYLKELYR